MKKGFLEISIFVVNEPPIKTLSLLVNSINHPRLSPFMRTEKLVEGSTELVVPNLSFYSTGESREFLPSRADVFYNPRMAFSRDVSVCALQAFALENPNLSVAECLSASGIRGLRYANEVKGLAGISMNDRSKKAFSLIKKNIKLLKLGKKAKASNLDANVFLSSNFFDVVDMDPFGTPVPFLDSAARSCSRFLMATATDMPVLCGVYPDVCFRNYNVRPPKVEFCHELALRILLSKTARVFAQYEKSINPLLSQSSDHYIRIFCRVEGGAQKANACLKNLGYLLNCSCGHRELVPGPIKREYFRCPFCNGKATPVGPVWVGRLFDRRFCASARDIAQERGFERSIKFLKKAVEEAGAPPLYYNIHKLCSSLKVEPPKDGVLIKKLKKSGFVGVRTHMGQDVNFRVNCSIEELKDILKNPLAVPKNFF